MKTTIYSLITAAVLAVGVSSCSDNYNTELEPVQTTRILSMAPNSEYDKYYKDPKLSLDAGAWNIEVNVTSNTRWIAEVDNGGGWCFLHNSEGAGDGTFTISVNDNMQEDRHCYVELYLAIRKDGQWMKDGERVDYIQIDQVASQVRITPSSLAPFPATNPQATTFNISANNVGWNLSVSYEGEEAAEFLTLTPGENMTQEDKNNFSGYGDADFRVSLQANRTAVARSGFITLTSAVGNYTVEIRQEKAEYTFDVSPSETQIIPAAGTTLNFGVLSLTNWEVASADGWVVFSSKRGEASADRTEISVTFLPNPTSKDRTATLNFKPTQDNYAPVTVDVVQRAFDMTFMASFDDVLDIMMSESQTKEFSLDSRFNWTMTLPSWIEAQPNEGEKSDSGQTITLTISQNMSNDTRTDTLKIVPQPTEFGNGVTIHPDSVGVQPIQVKLTQYGGREAAVSTPWLADGYTQTAATVMFNFYSPYYPVTEAGLRWKKATDPDTDTAWTEISTIVDNEIEGEVSFNLTGLDAATDYVAQGYVVTTNGAKKYGVVTYPFTTAGSRPGSGDNPTPGI